MSSRVGDSELKFINTHCQLGNMQYGCLATLCVCVCGGWVWEDSDVNSELVYSRGKCTYLHVHWVSLELLPSVLQHTLKYECVCVCVCVCTW